MDLEAAKTLLADSDAVDVMGPTELETVVRSFDPSGIYLVVDTSLIFIHSRHW